MPRMVVVNDVGRDHVEELLDVLEDTKVCSNVRMMESSVMDLPSRQQTKGLCQVQFKVRPTNLNTVIKMLKTHGFSTFDVVDVLSSADFVPTERKVNEGASWSALFPSSRDRLSTMEINNNIVGNSKFSFDHVFLIFLASYIASVGLLGDSVVNILASFFVSPLMSMILATAWGIVIGDVSLIMRAARNMCIGACLAWLNGAMIALVLSIHKDEEGLRTKDFMDGHFIYNGISINSQQIRDRGPPATVNLITTSIIAALSGVSIALGQASGISSAISGVTVAASLLPPLVNSGLCTVFGFVYPGLKTQDGNTLHQVAIVSFSMYLVTVSMVIVFCYLTFKFKHVGGLSFRIQAANRLSLQARARSVVAGLVRRPSQARADAGAAGAAPPLGREGRSSASQSEMGTELIPSFRGSSVTSDPSKKVVLEGPPSG